MAVDVPEQGNLPFPGALPLGIAGDVTAPPTYAELYADKPQRTTSSKRV